MDRETNGPRRKSDFAAERAASLKQYGYHLFREKSSYQKNPASSTLNTEHFGESKLSIRKSFEKVLLTSVDGDF